MKLKNRLLILLSSVAAVLLAAAIFMLCTHGLHAGAEAQDLVKTDNLTFERLTAENEKTKTILQNSYLELYGVPTNKFEYEANGGQRDGAPLSYAFDRNFSSIWQSQELWEGADPFINNVTVIFNDPTEIDRIIYQADCGWGNRGSFTKASFSYVPSEKNVGDEISDEDFQEIDEIDVGESWDTSATLITFNKSYKARAMRITWLAVHTKHLHCAAASEIVFLQPENEDIKAVKALFTDYNQFTLNDNVTTQYINDLRERVKHYATYDGELSYTLNRAEQVLAGKVSYDSRREMGTAEDSPTVLQRRGNIDAYARSTLKFIWYGSNRQVTGINITPDEDLIVYVDGEEGDPLPTLICSQFWGHWSGWKSGEYKLSLGKNVIHPGNWHKSSFHDDEGNPIPAGGAVYLVNPYVSPEMKKGKDAKYYTEQEQSDRVKVYFGSGTLFPVYRIGGDVEAYKQTLAEYVEQVEYDRSERRFEVFDETEIATETMIITARASAANRYYNELGYDPEEACQRWDTFNRAHLTFDGVILDEDDPNIEKYEGKYDPHAKWVGTNVRVMQPYALAYAFYEHLGTLTAWEGMMFTCLGTGWGMSHEMGHSMDIPERTLTETTNNMFAKFAMVDLAHEYENGDYAGTVKALAPDIRELESYWNTARGNYLLWWLIQEYDPTYWPHLENLYRYYDIYEKHRNPQDKSKLEEGFAAINATEKQVLLSSMVLGFDASYYFERWGYALNSNDPVFKWETASESFKTLMKEAKEAGKFTDLPKDNEQPKIWYIDAYQTPIREAHEEKKESLDIYSEDKGKAEILQISKGNNGYSLLLHSDKETDDRHLGFEIWEGEGENAKVIAFTHDSVYIDTTNYEGREPTYTVVAYDRALKHTKKSEPRTYSNGPVICEIERTHGTYFSLFEAFAAANSGDTIILKEDTHTGGIVVPAGLSITLRTDGKDRTIHHAGPEVVFTVPATSTLTLRGTADAKLIFDGGSNENVVQTSPFLSVTQGMVNAEYCVFRNNHVRKTIAGGGAVNVNGGSKVTFQNCEFTNNVGRTGGAVYVVGPNISGTSVTATDCKFNENDALIGGAMYISGNVYSDYVSLKDCVVERNTATTDGLYDCKTVPVGGAFYTITDAILSLSNTQVKENSAALGGAFYSDTALKLDNTVTVEGNTATQNGAAIYYCRLGRRTGVYATDHQLRVIGATFQGNKCEADGGSVIYMRDIADPENDANRLSVFAGHVCENEATYDIFFDVGTFTFEGEGGKWEHCSVFVSMETRLIAVDFPETEDVEVFTDRTLAEFDENGKAVFIEGKKGADFANAVGGYTYAGGRIEISNDPEALVFVLSPVTVTYSAGDEEYKVQAIKGVPFAVGAGFASEQHYVEKWKLEGQDGRDYATGDLYIPESDVTFTACETKEKLTVTFNYREGDEPLVYTVIPGQKISLPNIAPEKYKLNGWLDANKKFYAPYTTFQIEQDTEFNADIVEKLRVDYYIKPYESALRSVSKEPLLITTIYYEYGEKIVDLDLGAYHGDLTEEELEQYYLSFPDWIAGFETADGTDIDMYSHRVTSDLALYAVVEGMPSYITIVFNFPGEQDDVYENYTVKFGSDYTVKLEDIPEGYHVTSVFLNSVAIEWGELNGLTLTDLDYFTGIEITLEINRYDVTWKYNDDEVKETVKMAHGSQIVLEQPTDLPAGYYFGGYKIGRKMLTYNEETGLYDMKDNVITMNIGDTFTVTEDVVINMDVSIEPELKLAEEEPVLLKVGDEDRQLHATTIDDSLYSLLWQIDDDTVATITPEGVLTPVAVGIAKVTVFALRGGVRLTSLTFTVTVSTDVTLTLEPSHATLYLDADPLTLTVQAKVTGVEDYTLAWSSDREWAAAENSGVVTVGEVGTVTITVKCIKDGVVLATAECEIVVEKLALESISVNAEGAKTEYYEGDELETAGITVTAHYNNGDTKNVDLSECTFEPSGRLTVGITKITVTYKDQTAEYEITVNEVAEEGLIVDAAKVKSSYLEGEAFSYDGLSVSVRSNNGDLRALEREEYNVTVEGLDDASDLLPGTHEVTLTVTYNSFTETVTVSITVENRTLDRIEITSQPQKLVYFEGETFDPAGMVVTAHYNNGDVETVVNYNVDKTEPLKAEDTEIVITYLEKTAQVEITVKAVVLERIELTLTGVKTEYFEGEELDTANLVVTAHYNNGDKIVLLSGQYSVTSDGVQDGKLVAGTQTVTVSYESIEATYTVDVKKIELTHITVDPSNLPHFYEGDELNTEALVVTAHYNNETSQVLTKGDYSVEPVGPLAAGTQTVTVRYEEKSETFEIEVEKVAVTHISVDTSSVTLIYFAGDTFDPKGLIVWAHYNNGTQVVLNEEDYILDKTGALQDTDQTVTVCYETFTTVINITVKPLEIVKITLNTENVKKTYFVGDTLSTEGLVITVELNSGRTYQVTDDSEYTVDKTDELKADDKVVTVIYKRMVASYAITVNEIKATGISVNTDNLDRAYIEGEKFSTAGLRVTLDYNNGKTEELGEDQFTVEGLSGDPLELGESSVTFTVKYMNFEREVTVEIAVEPKTLESIKITKQPEKTEYYVGDYFETAGMEVTAYYNNGTHHVVSEYTYFTAPLTLGMTEITITYAGQEAKVAIKVHAVELSEIKLTTAGVKKNYFEGDLLNTENLVVTAHYNNGSTAVIPAGEYTVSPAGELKVGDRTVTVNYQGRTAEYSITVEAVVPTELVISADAVDKTYLEGDKFDPANLAVTVRYNNGDERLLGAGDYTVEGLDDQPLASGKQEVTFTVVYREDGKQVTESVTVEITVDTKALDRIEVTELPDKIEYFVGDVFDPAGMVVTAHYNNGAQHPVDGFDYSRDPFTAAGEVDVTITYAGKETTVKVTVKEVELVSISLNTTSVRKTYYVGEELDTARLVVLAEYNNGTTKTLSEGDYEVEPIKLDQVGEQIITVSYADMVATYTVTVEDIFVTHISVEAEKAKTAYYEGEMLDTAGLIVILYYNNNYVTNATEFTTDLDEIPLTTEHTTVTVSCKGCTATYSITVEAISLVRISLETENVQKKYVAGQMLDTSNLVVNAHYNHALKDHVVEAGEYTVDKQNQKLKVTDTEVVVSYRGITASYNISVDEAPVSHITLDTLTQNVKTKYFVGERIDLDGLIVTAHYEDGTSKVVTGYTCDKTDPLALTDTEVTITFENKSATFTIEVEKDLTALNAAIEAAKQKLSELKAAIEEAIRSLGFLRSSSAIALMSVDETTKESYISRVEEKYNAALAELTVDRFTLATEVESYAEGVYVEMEDVQTDAQAVNDANETFVKDEARKTIEEAQAELEKLLENSKLYEEHRAEYAAQLGAFVEAAQSALASADGFGAVDGLLGGFQSDADLLEEQIENAIAEDSIVRIVVEGIKAVGKTYDGTDFIEFDLSEVVYRNAGTGEEIPKEVAEAFNLSVSGRLSNYNAGKQIALITSISIEGSLIDSGEYALALSGQQAFAEVEVEKAILIVRAVGGSVEYEGFVNGEDESVLTGVVSFERSGNVLMPRGIESANYEIVFEGERMHTDRTALWIGIAIGCMSFAGTVLAAGLYVGSRRKKR